jgi:glycosyltransferase involved in cell wall biosynthesis
MKRLFNKFAPLNSTRRKLIKRVLVILHLKKNVIAGYYNTWVSQGSKQIQLQQTEDMPDGPLISVVVPAYNTPRRFLDELVNSIISQSYSKWELILVNGSDNSNDRDMINSYAEKDARIKAIEINNYGISGNTNLGIKASTGEYIAFCDHDDVLEPFALSKVAIEIINNKAELIYTDEDKISEDSVIYFDPHFKPDFSPDLLTHVNYINHLTVIKKKLIERVGMLNLKRDGAQDYDLLLRIVDLDPIIVHIPEVLYHWRAVQNSTAYDFSSKKNITDAAKLSLEEHFARQGVNVSVKPKDNQPGFYKLIFEKTNEVSVIITHFSSDALIRLYTEILFKKTDTSNINVELILPKGTGFSTQSKNIKIVEVENNKQFLLDAVNTSKYKNIIIINQVAIPLDGDWLNNLCGPLLLDHIGAVAPLIVRNQRIIEDAGLARTIAGETMMLFRSQPAFNNQTFFGNTNWVRDVDALTGGVTAVRRNEFLDFITSTKASKGNKPVQEFSIYNIERKKYNTIFTEVILDNHSIRIRPSKRLDESSFFSPNLIQDGRDYEIYTPELTAIEILININETMAIYDK